MFVGLFIATLVVAIIFHEFGHFATAKAFGMKVERFFVGFGPTLWSVRRGETEYGLKAVPAGGFVKIAGMSAFEEIETGDRRRAFYAQAAWKRAIVLVAGSVTHFIFAALLLFGALWLAGLPDASNVVRTVAEDTPAAASDLRPGDEIVAVAGEPTEDFEQVRAAVLERGGETVTLTILRDGAREQRTVTLAERGPDGTEGGFLGVAPEAATRRLSPPEAALATVRGDVSLWRLTSLTMGGLADALSPESLSAWVGQLGTDEPRRAQGPISVVGIGQAVSALGGAGEIFAVIGILVQLNIVIGVLNLVPLPPLDGGHLAVVGVERAVNGVRGLLGRSGVWRLDPAVITPVALTVILLLGTLTITAVVIDILRPASELIR